MGHRYSGDLARVLESARHEDPEMVAEVFCYCENPRCCIREVNLQVKEHEGQKRLPVVIPCPVCQQAMRFHSLDT